MVNPRRGRGNHLRQQNKRGDRANHLSDLLAVQQELPGADGIVVVPVALRVGGDVHAVEEDLDDLPRGRDSRVRIDAEGHEDGQRSPSMTYRMQRYWPYWYA